MLFRDMIALGAALLMPAIAEPSFAQSQGAPVARFQCGEGLDQKKVVGRTFSGMAQWDGGTPFHLSVTFNANCTITDRTDGGRPRSEGEWEQTPDGAVLWEPVRDGASVYKGEIQFDGSMQGIMAARGGRRGTFTLNPDFVPPSSAKCDDGGAGRAVVGRTFTGQGRWDVGVQWTWTVTFNADCTVTDQVDQGNLKLGGYWTPDGDTVVWRNVNGVAQYRGSLQADGSIRGSIVNKKGDKGGFALRPKP